MQASALVVERRAREARRPEARGRIARKAVALFRLAEQAGLHLRLVVLRVEDRDGIGPRREAAEHAGRAAASDARDRATHFAPRHAETIRRRIEPATH